MDEQENIKRSAAVVRVNFEGLEDLKGLITHSTGRKLAILAGQILPSRAIVEVGSYCGKSTAYLAAGASGGTGAKVWAVDPWDLPGNIYGKHGFTSPEVKETFEAQLTQVGLRNQVIATKGFSKDVAAMWSGPAIGLLFIDGSHEYEDVLKDYKVWSPHLASEAVVVFDDYESVRSTGVKKAVDRLIAEGKLSVIEEYPPLMICLAR